MDLILDEETVKKISLLATQRIKSENKLYQQMWDRKIQEAVQKGLSKTWQDVEESESITTTIE